MAEYNEMDKSESGGAGVSLTIKDASTVLADCHIGDSIAVDGICLTVTEFGDDWFKVGIAPETVRRTTVSQWEKGRRVDLERAVASDVRFGGHYVQGHVDTIGCIETVVPDGNSLVFTFALRDERFAKYIVEKGFICVDGASLTVTRADSRSFSIAMIKHTQEALALGSKRKGEFVNVEVDVTGKVIERQVALTLEAQIADSSSALHKVIQGLVDVKVREALNQ